MNTILKRYFPKKINTLMKFQHILLFVENGLSKVLKNPSGEAKVTLREEGIKFFEMYYRAIELWYEREFLNTL